MSRKSRFRLYGRKLVGGAAALAFALAGAVAITPAASAVPYCGQSKYVKEIKVAKWANNHFQIVLTPTYDARVHAAYARNKRAAVVEQWHAIQRCVPGLYGALADTIWDQLECHQLNSAIVLPRESSLWATGDTYDLESWRPTLPRAVPGKALIFTECLNRLGVDPKGPFGSPIRPDAGVTDLYGAWANIA